MCTYIPPSWISLSPCIPSPTTEHQTELPVLYVSFPLAICSHVVAYTGEGNGNPLQCSCLENPWDGGAWWAACHLWGHTKSDTTEVT